MARIMTAHHSIEDLVRRAQGGDADAFAELARLYRARLEALAASRMTASLRRTCPIEDVVQETFTQALESIGGFQWKGEESFLRWLGAIARNFIARSARRGQRPVDLELVRDVPASGTSPSRRARREERFDRLEKALRNLTPDQQEAIQLSRIEGLKIREIAARTGKTPDAIQQLIVRGLRRLRRNFGDTESLHLPDRALDLGQAQDADEDKGNGKDGRAES